MRRYGLLICLCYLSIALFGQEKNPFDNLAGSTWLGEGKWMNEQAFRQEISFNWDIPQKVLHAVTKGNVSATAYEFGVRSSGIRHLTGKQGKFWEFDVFGQVTEGKVFSEGKNIFYQYEYDTGNGVQVLTDAWIWSDVDHYDFKVGVYKDGKWESVYAKASFVRKSD